MEVSRLALHVGQFLQIMVARVRARMVHQIGPAHLPVLDLDVQHVIRGRLGLVLRVGRCTCRQSRGVVAFPSAPLGVRLGRAQTLQVLDSMGLLGLGAARPAPPVLAVVGGSQSRRMEIVSATWISDRRWQAQSSLCDLDEMHGPDVQRCQIRGNSVTKNSEAGQFKLSTALWKLTGASKWNGGGRNATKTCMLVRSCPRLLFWMGGLPRDETPFSSSKTK